MLKFLRRFVYSGFTLVKFRFFILVNLSGVYTFYKSTNQIWSRLKSNINFILLQSYSMLMQISLMQLHKFSLYTILFSINFFHIFSHKLFNIYVFIASTLCNFRLLCFHLVIDSMRIGSCPTIVIGVCFRIVFGCSSLMGFSNNSASRSTSISNLFGVLFF